MRRLQTRLPTANLPIHWRAVSLKRHALFPVPGWLLKILLGEMSQLILGSQRVIPERLLVQGFTFQYNNLADALDQALSGKYEQAITD
jgi:uncharacterized protein